MPPRTPSTVTSRGNASFRRLLEARRRGRAGELLLVEGRRLVEEALAARLEFAETAVSTSFEATPESAPLLSRLEAEAPVRVLSNALLRSLSELETSPGLLALCRPPRFDAAALLREAQLLLVVVGVQNPGNLGALLRTAEASGASGAWITEGSADPFSWKCLRGAMGSAFRLPHQAGVSSREVIGTLREAGLRTVAATAGPGTRHDRLELRGRVALLVGAEGAGLPEELVARADARARIPLAAGVESLNVSVAAGVLLFEAARQRGFTGMLE